MRERERVRTTRGFPDLSCRNSSAAARICQSRPGHVQLPVQGAAGDQALPVPRWDAGHVKQQTPPRAARPGGAGGDPEEGGQNQPVGGGGSSVEPPQSAVLSRECVQQRQGRGLALGTLV